MKMNPLSWLRGCLVKAEVARWADAGLVAPDQCERIASQYDAQCCGIESSRLARVALYFLSSAAMLLAVVLVVGNEWAFIPFSLKVGVVAAVSLAAHGAGYWLRFVRGDAAGGDWLFFVGTLTFGGAVWVVIGAEHTGTLYPWALCIWSIGALPLGLVLDSRRLIVLANVLAVVWFLWQSVIGEGEATASTASVLVGITLFTLHWSYTNRSRLVVWLALGAASLFWMMIPIAQSLGRQGWFWIALAGPLWWLVGQRHAESHEFARIYEQLGRAIVFLALPALSLPSVTANLVAARHQLPDWLSVLSLLGLVIVLAPGPRRWELRRDWLPLAVLAALVFVPALVGAVGQRVAGRFGEVASNTLAVIYGVAAVAVAVALVLSGGQRGCAGRVLLGVTYAIVWIALVCHELAGHLTHAATACAVTAAALLLAARYGPRWWTTHEATTGEST
jgi:hypothetical protein